MPAVVRDQAEAERLQAALIENMVREDLNPVEEASACAALVEDLGLTKEELARRVGRSRPAVSNLIRLLELPDEALEMLESGELSEGHGRALLGASGNDVRRRLARDAARGGLVGPRDREQGSAGRPAKSEAEAQGGRSRRARRRSATPATPSRRRSATRSRSRAKGEGIAVELRFDDLDEAQRARPSPAQAPLSGPERAARRRYHRRPAGD